MANTAPATKHEQVIEFAQKAPEDVRKLSGREKKDLVIAKCGVTQGYLQQMIHRDPGLRKFFNVQARRPSRTRPAPSTTKTPPDVAEALQRIKGLDLKDKTLLLKELDTLVRKEIDQVESAYKTVHAA